jgi:hypothetical protein
MSTKTVIRKMDLYTIPKKDRFKYSEEWIVKYRHKVGEFLMTSQASYLSPLKNQEKKVERMFKQEFPAVEIVSITYQ